MPNQPTPGRDDAQPRLKLKKSAGSGISPEHPAEGEKNPKLILKKQGHGSLPPPPVVPPPSDKPRRIKLGAPGGTLTPNTGFTDSAAKPPPEPPRIKLGSPMARTEMNINPDDINLPPPPDAPRIKLGAPQVPSPMDAGSPPEPPRIKLGTPQGPGKGLAPPAMPDEPPDQPVRVPLGAPAKKKATITPAEPLPPADAEANEKRNAARASLKKLNIVPDSSPPPPSSELVQPAPPEPKSTTDEPGPPPPPPKSAIPPSQAVPQIPKTVVAVAPPKQITNPQFSIVINTVKPGIRWKDYLIVRPLQAGLAGATYEAYHYGRQKRVALKFLDVPHDDIAQQRFCHFAERLEQVEHDSICNVVDHVWQPPYVFIVSELLTFRDGPALNLEEYCNRFIPADQFAPERQVLKVGYQLATALAAAHDNGILHGDLKPANLLFEEAPTEDGSLRLRMKITDFGVAQMIGAEAFAHKLGPVLKFEDDVDQPAIETAAFFSPEQWKGVPVNKFSDLYSASAVIHYFLTLNWEAKRKKPSAYRSGIHEAWDPIICMGMRKNPEQRFESATEFAEYLNIIEAPKI